MNIQDLDHWGEIEIDGSQYDFNIFINSDGEIQACLYPVYDGVTDTNVPVFNFKCFEVYH